MRTAHVVAPPDIWGINDVRSDQKSRTAIKNATINVGTVIFVRFKDRGWGKGDVGKTLIEGDNGHTTPFCSTYLELRRPRLAVLKRALGISGTTIP